MKKLKNLTISKKQASCLFLVSIIGGWFIADYLKELAVTELLKHSYLLLISGITLILSTTIIFILYSKGKR
jgi:hypothetical protein